MSLVQMLAQSIDRYASKPVILQGEKEISYTELGRMVDGLQKGLQDLGVRPGDHVAIILPNGIEFVVSYFAVLNCGATVVPLNLKHKPNNIKYIIEETGARVVITFEGMKNELEKHLQAGFADHILLIDGDHPSSPDSFVSMLNDGKHFVSNDEVNITDHAIYLYTSGSTGNPKGVILTHGNFISNMEATNEVLGFNRDDVFITALPLYHSYGHMICMLMPIMVGARFISLMEFSPELVLSEIQRHNATIFAGFPTYFTAILQHPNGDSFDLSSVRIATSGGASLPLQVMEDFERTFGVTILEGYGHTEAAPVVSFNPPGKRKVGSVGRPIPGVEVRMVDEKGKEVGPGEEGELLIRGPSVMKGYFNLPEKTEEVFENGWLKMQDLFKIDGDGYMYLIDRMVQLIRVDGENVYPREVEEILYSYPKVFEAAVIGATDEAHGEIVKAFVSLKAGEECGTDEIIEFCEGHLAPFKVPKQVVIMKELPKTITGKLSKKELQ
jgi:long-chain acyl-CoA synthetase